MLADRAWVKRNLGFDPIERNARLRRLPLRRSLVPKARLKICSGRLSTSIPNRRLAKVLCLRHGNGFVPVTAIPWPKELAPKTGPKPSGTANSPLPKGNVLMVTWTVDEGHALSRVLTPGKDSRNDYAPYRHNYARISEKMRKGCPAIQENRLGTYWTTKIGGQKVVVSKCDSHLSQDIKVLPKKGTLPNYDVWRQIIEEVHPKFVITTGTAGGIGTDCEVGDVVVSPIVRFDGTHWLKSAPYHDAIYSELAATKQKWFATAVNPFKPMLINSKGQHPAAEDHAEQQSVHVGRDHGLLWL